MSENPQADKPQLYTLNEVAEILHVTKRTLYRMIDEGRLETVRPIPKGKIFVKKETMDAMIGGKSSLPPCFASENERLRALAKLKFASEHFQLNFYDGLPGENLPELSEDEKKFVIELFSQLLKSCKEYPANGEQDHE